jgi:hypothetical protein
VGLLDVGQSLFGGGERVIAYARQSWSSLSARRFEAGVDLLPYLGGVGGVLLVPLAQGERLFEPAEPFVVPAERVLVRSVRWGSSSSWCRACAVRGECRIVVEISRS